MGYEQRGGSGATVGVVIALIAVAMLAVPCLLGAFLVLGLYSFRSTAMPAPPVMVQPTPMTSPPMIQPAPAVPPPRFPKESVIEVTPGDTVPAPPAGDEPPPTESPPSIKPSE